jgi:hypothetical protein
LRAGPSDKRHREQLIPVPESLAAEIRAIRGAWAPWVTETAAGVEKLEGGLWHAYRRKWATERKELPLKDVAAAGGWKDVTTLLRCYQHAEGAGVADQAGGPSSARRSGETVAETVCHPLLEFAGFDAGVRRASFAQLLQSDEPDH